MVDVYFLDTKFNLFFLCVFVVRVLIISQACNDNSCTIERCLYFYSDTGTRQHIAGHLIKVYQRKVDFWNRA